MDVTKKFGQGFKKLRIGIKLLARYRALFPIIRTLQNFYLIFRFFFDCRSTRLYLIREWGSKYPNYIPLESCDEIKFALEPNIFAYNPTVCIDRGQLRFFTRITNVANIPKVNLFGQLQKRGAKSGTLNGIIEFKLDDSYEVKAYNEIVKLERVPNLEDPKAFVLNNHMVLFCNLVIKEPDGHDRTFICKNAIFDLDSKIIQAIESPYSKNIEKNWIPIDEKGGNLRLFYSCNPLNILHLNLNDGSTQIEVIDDSLELDFHGGSQLIRVNEDLLVRVVRRKMQVKDLGMIAISYLMFHNNDMSINKISKPFLFRKFGFEICNGLAREDDSLVFTWGEDDYRNYIGKIRIQKLLDWAST